MKATLKGLVIILILAVFVLSGCTSDSSSDGATGSTGSTGDTGDTGDTGSTGSTGGIVTASAAVALSTSQISVKTDNSDEATITAYVLDSNSAAVAEAEVSFSASSGMLSSSIATTDESGEATVTFSSGNVDKSNQTATIQAAVSGIDPTTIPILISGTTIELTSTTSSLEAGGSNSDTLTILIKDAGEIPIYDADVTLSVATSSSGTVTFSAATGATGVDGTLDIDVTGSTQGSVTVVVTGMGVTATQAYKVEAVGSVFAITTPTADPVSLSTNTNLTVTVNDTATGPVVFVTSFGNWYNGSDVLQGPTYEVPVIGNTATAYLKSAEAGVASIQVYDENSTSIIDTLKVAVSAPSSEAAQISFQSNSSVVAPSIGDSENIVELIATVKSASDQIVGGAPVFFSISNPTGGGEYITPIVAYTNDYGIATARFIAGSLSSDAEGIDVTATIVGTAIDDTINLVVGGTAGSIVMGLATKIIVVSDNVYSMPISCLVADSNGNAMANTTISLNLWPTYYATGVWAENADGELIPDRDLPVQKNEDLDGDLILDLVPIDEDANGDGMLTPPNSSAGTLPSSVETDENGIANFELTYLKQFSGWVRVKITASTMVLGTEFYSILEFWLHYAEGEEEYLPNSPFI